MRNVKVVLLEAALAGMAGLAIALAANAISPRGLGLSRDYFPGRGDSIQSNVSATNTVAGTGGGESGHPFDTTLRRLEQDGLQLVTSNRIAELFRDPRYEQGLVVFVDARDDAHYQAAHIPGAWQFDHYRAERHLATVLPACLNAHQVIVYCNGNACEDSEFAAIILRDAGVPRENLFVYAGGVTEWMTNGLPVEKGARGSGAIPDPKP